MPRPLRYAPRRRRAAAPRATLNLRPRAPRTGAFAPLPSAEQRSTAAFLAAADRLIASEGALYRQTSGYMRLDLGNPTHRRLLEQVRHDVSMLRSARRSVTALSGTLRSTPTKKMATPFSPRLSFSALSPRRTTPSSFRQLPDPNAARKDAIVRRLEKAAGDLDKLIVQLFQVGSEGRPVTGSHWSEGFVLRQEPERTWRASDGTVFVGQRDAFMRKLIMKLMNKRDALVGAMRPVRAGQLSGLGAVTRSETTPLMWLLVGVTVGYLAFNTATA